MENKSALYVEFGAGRGGLSSYVANDLPKSDSTFLLIERERRKFKLDKDIKSKGF